VGISANATDLDWLIYRSKFQAALPGQPRHTYDNSGTPSTDDHEISHNQSPDLGITSKQRITRSVDRAPEKPEAGMEDTSVDLSTVRPLYNVRRFPVFTRSVPQQIVKGENYKQALPDAIQASLHQVQVKHTIGQHLVNEADGLGGDRGVGGYPTT
jgi:hypothetical protein